MAEQALLASRSGAVADWLEPTLDALGYGLAATLTVESPEHGRYNLPPGLVERLGEATAGASLLAVDELLHSGQLVDLQAELPSVSVRDRRGLVWRRLAADNPVAEQRLARRDVRVERRRAARDARDGDDRSAHLEELDRRCQQLRSAVAECRDDQRRQVRNAYDGVDARVTLVGVPTAPTTELWTALTDEPGDAGPFTPPRPATAVTTAGPHEVAVTDTPGLVEGLPDWYVEAVPGTITALEQSAVIVVVGDSTADFRGALRERFDGTVLRAVTPAAAAETPETVDRTATGAVLSRVAQALPSSRVDLSLPYSDDAHALVSWVHDRTAVQSLDYDDRIRLTVDAPAARTPDLRQRVDRVGGDCEFPRSG